MARTTLLLVFVATVQLFSTQVLCSECTADARSCEFSLVIRGWRTMRHMGTARKVSISDTDGKIYFIGTNDTLPENEVVLADGNPNERSIHIVNDVWPGPSLEMYVDQNITIHVTNQLPSEAFTIHWHGLEVRGTPWMDGAGYVTQCPILPRQTFTYNLMSGRKGTYFYHTHSAGLVGMGAHGALIIKDRTDQLEEHVLIVQDYDNEQTNIDHVLNAMLGVVKNDGHFFEGYRTIEETATSNIKLTSSLINGKGRVYDANGNRMTNTPLTIFRVERGKLYRFRLINAAIAHQYTIEIDNHPLDVVATDGHDVVSTTVNKIRFHTGERYDFILNANQNIGNYWIRMRSMVAEHSYPAYAILRYERAADDNPISLERPCTESNPCSMLGCSTPHVVNHTCIRVDELKADGSDPAPSENTGNFKEFFMVFGLGLTPQGVRGHVNGVTYTHPPISALTQPREMSSVLCTESDNCSVEKICNCIKPINLDLGDVVQLNLLNMGFLSVIHHPIHLHGYSFHVLKTGVRLSNDSHLDMGTNPDIDCGGISNIGMSVCNNASWSNPSWAGGKIPGIDLTRAPRKDTITVPAGGYAVVRFVADNPGLWFLHCHIEGHVNLGMGILLNDSFPHIPPPPKGFPECRSYPPPDWILNQSGHVHTTSTASTKTTECGNTNGQPQTLTAEESFEPKVFWGVVGALLFVVLAQFVTMAICMRVSRSRDYKL